MGDRAWVGITFYDVPEKDVPATLHFLIDYGLIDYKEREIVLGEQYTCDEMNLCWVSDEVATFVDKHPDIVVEAAQGNRYEFNGEQLYNTPELGMFSGDASGDGAVILTSGDAEGIFEWLTKQKPEASAADLHAAIQREFGEPWGKTFVALRERFPYEERDKWPVLTGPEDLAQALEDAEES